MMTILKRTTAIAALAALPLAPAAALAQTQQQSEQSSDYGVQSQSELVPSDKAIDSYKSQAETAPDKAEVTKTESGEYVERTTQGEQQGQQAQAQGAQQEGAQAGQQAQGTQQEGAQAGQQAQGTQQEGAQTGQQAAAATGPDVIVARVGDADIMRSDVMGVIGALPPQLQQQPAEMLIPMALDQLVLRELILQEARGAGLDSDPDVVAMLDDAANAPEQARENAMVQVWLDRELEGAVTDQKVQETYGNIENQLGDQVPPLEQIRPQIEQELRRMAFLELSEELHTNADVTLFGPDGEPITEGESSTQ